MAQTYPELFRNGDTKSYELTNDARRHVLLVRTSTGYEIFFVYGECIQIISPYNRRQNDREFHVAVSINLFLYKCLKKNFLELKARDREKEKICII